MLPPKALLDLVVGKFACMFGVERLKDQAVFLMRLATPITRRDHGMI